MVLITASMASAGMSLVVGGVESGSEITIAPSDTIWVGIYDDTGGAQFAVALAITEGCGTTGEWTGGTVVYCPPAPPPCYPARIMIWYPEYPCLMYLVDNEPTTNLPGAGLQAQAEFHCLADGDAVIELIDIGSFQTVDTLTIHQVTPGPVTYHVDAAGGSDLNDGLTYETAFATIQKGVDTAKDGDTILVWPGVYEENVNFDGKAITVKSAAEPATVTASVGYAFEFYNSEGPDSMLENFIIADGQYGIYLGVGCSPKLTNLTIVNNDFGISALENADPDISNCIFYNNDSGDLDGCDARYSWVEQDIEPVSYWNLDEGEGDTAYDSVGDNHGTVNEADWTTGQVNSALSFDANDYVVGSSSPFDFEDATFTVAAWFKTASSDGTIVSEGGGSTGGWSLDLKSGKVRVTLKTSAGLDAFLVDGISFCSDNTWHHVGAVVTTSTSHYMGNSGYIYIDGATVSNINWLIHAYNSSGDNWAIGAKAAGTASNFNGLIDEVAVYDRALSLEEIEQLYTNGLAGHGYVDPLFADPVAGDYHLKSQTGRWDPDGETWVTDAINSPSIDGGDPNSDSATEPWPNGNRINIGAYGNTPEASRSCATFDDLRLMSGDWLQNDSITDIAPFPDGDGTVDLRDFAFWAKYWLRCAGR